MEELSKDVQLEAEVSEAEQSEDGEKKSKKPEVSLSERLLSVGIFMATLTIMALAYVIALLF